MLRRKEQVVTTLTRGVDVLFKKNKITRYLGHAKINGPRLVTVENSAEPLELKAKNILIATGSTPASLPGVALDSQRIGTSTEALSYSDVPEHLVVIGAGFIGLELGSVWRRLGAKVTVLEYLDRILFGMDTELAGEAQKLLQKQGLEFRLSSKVTAARSTKGKCVVECEGAEPISCDRVLVAVGRVPNTDHLGLESVGIELHKKGTIPVNDQFATSAEGIYAIGDVIVGPMLAHKAEEEGIACVEMIAGKGGHVNYEVIPGIIYTNPELAGVGLTEDMAKEKGINVRVGKFPFRANGRAVANEDYEGVVKFVADAETDRILGAHILSHAASELIAETVAVMEFGGSSEDLGRTVHAHPTLSEAVKEAALHVERRAIHIGNR